MVSLAPFFADSSSTWIIRDRFRSRSAKAISIWATAIVMGWDIRSILYSEPYRLPESVTSIDYQRRARHVSRCIARQIDREGAELVRFAVAAHRNLLLKCLDDFRMNLLPPHVRVGHESTGQNGVDRDAVRSPVSGSRACEL